MVSLNFMEFLMRNLLLCLLPSCLALGSATALATSASGSDQDPHEEDHAGHVHGTGHLLNDLEEVIVRATPLDRNLVEMAQSATVLKDATLQREVANNIGDTLTRCPACRAPALARM